MKIGEYDYLSSKFIFPKKDVKRIGGIDKYIQELKNSKIPKQIEIADKIEQNVDRRKEIESLRSELKKSIERLEDSEISLKGKNGKVSRREKALTVVNGRFNVFTRIHNYIKSVTNGIKDFFNEGREKRRVDLNNSQRLQQLRDGYVKQEEAIKKYEGKIKEKYEDEMIKLNYKYFQLEDMIEHLYKCESEKAKSRIVSELREELENATKTFETTEQGVQRKTDMSEKTEEGVQNKTDISKPTEEKVQGETKKSEKTELELQKENATYCEYYNKCNDIKEMDKSIDTETKEFLEETNQILRRKMDRIKDEYSKIRINNCEIYDEQADDIQGDNAEEIKKRMAMYVNRGAVSRTYVEKINEELRQKYEKNKKLYEEDDKKLEQVISKLEDLYKKYEKEIKDFKDKKYEKTQMQHRENIRSNKIRENIETESSEQKLNVDEETIKTLKEGLLRFAQENGYIEKTNEGNSEEQEL